MGEMVEFFFIGYAGEINARRKPIDISDLFNRWPEATPVLMVNRPKEEAPYPATTTRDGATLYWQVSDIDVAKSGFGQAQVYMRDANGELLGKSEVINTLIKASLNGAEQENPPTAVETWVTKFLDAHNEAKEGYVAQNQGAENSGKVLGIGADGKVVPMEYSGTGGTGESGEDGGYYTPSVSGEGVLTWTPSKDGMAAVDSANIKGPAGNDGETPEKGVDYWTEADKEEIVSDVLAALPTWEGGTY